jgi:hypothetical protein
MVLRRETVCVFFCPGHSLTQRFSQAHRICVQQGQGSFFSGKASVHKTIESELVCAVNLASSVHFKAGTLFAGKLVF